MSDKFNFVVPQEKSECKYIGFNFEKDSSSFIFPCRYLDESAIEEDKKEQTFKQEARKIITLLKRVQKEYLLAGESGELTQFYSMIWLIQDYIDHGYYVESETISKIGANGKINWKKTLKLNDIAFNSGNIIYKNFIRDKKMIDSSQTLTQIYKACLEFSVQKLGFIFGIEKIENSIYKLETCDKNFLTYFLKEELNKTFRDYKKTLLKHLISIINNIGSQEKNNGYSIYDGEFEYVFEMLINKVFGTENVKDFYNTYSYFLPERYKSSRLRPDTIMKDERSKTYYIIDAKYYSYGYTNNPKDLPPASSISKQVGYNHYLKDNLKEKEKDFKVKSIFVLPYSSSARGEKIKYVGFAQSDRNSREDDRVAVCLIDLKKLIDTYLSNSENLSPELLIHNTQEGMKGKK